MPCQYDISWIQEGVSIIMQVLMIFTFLTLFFFNYVVKVEKKQFLKQVDLVVDDIMHDWFQNNPILSYSKDYWIQKLKHIQTQIEKEKNDEQNYKRQDQIDQNNSHVKHLAEKFLLWFAVAFVVMVGFLMLFQVCVHPVSYFLNNSVVLFFIAMVEFLFLENVAGNYISADPNKIKTYILSDLQRFAQQQSLKTLSFD